MSYVEQTTDSYGGSWSYVDLSELWSYRAVRAMGIMRAMRSCGAVDCGTEAVGYGAIRLYRLLYEAMELWAMEHGAL
jgi:hypothetical protein